MDQRSVIVVSYDGLGCGYLGPYGSTWSATPVWNELAANSCLYDFMFATGCLLRDATRGWWGGTHPAERRGDGLLLAADCSASEISNVLISDDAAILDIGREFQFEQTMQLKPSSDQMASSLDDTGMFRNSLAACELVLQLKPPFCAWVHLSALTRAWDVPHDLRTQLADIEDPEVPRFVIPPNHEVSDPDELWAMQLAYAAQMVAVDASLGLFVDVVQQIRQQCEVAFCATSPRGYALGSHGLAHVDAGFGWSEEMHIPLIVDSTDFEHAGRRVGLLHDVRHVNHIVRGLLGLVPNEVDHLQTDRVAYVSDIYQAFRTRNWLLRRTLDDGRDCELFVKPDDRWDANEISSRCPDVVAAMQAALSDYLAAAERGDLAALDPLPEIL